MLKDVWVLIWEILRRYQIYFNSAVLRQFLRVTERLKMLNLNLIHIHSEIINIEVCLLHFCFHNKLTKSAEFRFRAQPNSISSFSANYSCYNEYFEKLIPFRFVFNIY